MSIYSPFNERNLCHENNRFQKDALAACVDSSKFYMLRDSLKPLTIRFQDLFGRIIQLFCLGEHRLIGAVLDLEGRLIVVSGSKIINPLNPDETEADLLNRLKQRSLKRWDLIYDIKKASLAIWPHLEAAGKGTISFINDTFEETVQKAKAHLEKIIGDPPEKKVPGSPSTGALNSGYLRTYRLEMEGSFHTMKADNSRPHNHPNKIHESQDAAKNLLKALHNKLRLDKTLTPDQEKCIKDFIGIVKEKWRENRGYTAFAGAVYGTPKTVKTYYNKERIGYGPGTKQFQETLKQTGLTSSYNKSNPDNPITEDGGMGEIGGVACSTAYFKGIFDGPESLFEDRHFFSLPLGETKEFPFSNEELRLILRELAQGIYVYGTIPFFSLHFNQHADLFPVIHPAYSGTLVGRVTGMLDYIMKGYLNGGVFDEEFVQGWYLDSDWDRRSVSAMHHLIDFEEYCKKHLKGDDANYLSVRDIIFAMQEQNMAPSDPPILDDYREFSNSFRIIAKQKSLQKTGPLFIIDADFDVEYTIKPSPRYQDELDIYLRKHGYHPPSYTNLIAAYEMIKVRIHDHLVKFPLAKKYFAMLSVINFFSGYFSTLKKCGKVPVLPVLETGLVDGCPPLFPYLPIKPVEEVVLAFNPKQLAETIKSRGVEVEVRAFLGEMFAVDIFTRMLGRSPEVYLSEFSNVHDETIIYQNLPKKYFNDLILKVILPITGHFPSEEGSVDHRKNILAITKQALFLQLFNRSNLSVQRHLLQNREELEEDCLKHVRAWIESLEKGFKASLKNIPVLDLLLPGNEKSILRLKEKIVEPFLDRFFSLFVDQELEVLKTQVRTVRVKPDINSEALIHGMRIVGGCGMQLEKMNARISPIAQAMIEGNFAKMELAHPETWIKVKSEGSEYRGAVFSLLFEDAPLDGDGTYQWMTKTTVIDGKDVANFDDWDKALELMHTGKLEEFKALVTKNPYLAEMCDNTGQTLMHFSAMLKDDIAFTEFLYGLQPQ